MLIKFVEILVTTDGSQGDSQSHAGCSSVRSFDLSCSGVVSPLASVYR